MKVAGSCNCGTAPLKKHWKKGRNIPKSFPEEMWLDVLEEHTEYHRKNARKIIRRYTLKIKKKNICQGNLTANYSAQHMDS